MARMRRAKVVCCAVLALACAIGGVSCGSDGGSDDDDGKGEGAGGTLDDTYGIDDGASGGVATSQRVTATRSATLTLETGAEVAIPAGAVARALDLSIARPSDAEAVALLDGLSASAVASAPYVLTPHGTAFLKPVTITLPVASGSRGLPLVVGWRADEDDPEWKTLGAASVEGDTASFTIDHFSILVLLEAPATDGMPEAGVTEPDAGGLDASAPEGGVSTTAKVSNVGAACTLEDEETDCTGTAALCRQTSMPGSATNPGGMCSAVCTASDQCGPGGTCPLGELIAQVGTSTALGSTAHCAPACTLGDPSSCRAGYSCVTLATLLALGQAGSIAAAAKPFCYPTSTQPDAGAYADAGNWRSDASAPLTLQSLDSGL